MARSVNSRTDSHCRSSRTAAGGAGSGMVSEGTCHSASPGTRSGSRLVASTTTPWLAASSAATARAALSIRYSQLSMTSRDRLPAMATATARQRRLAGLLADGQVPGQRPADGVVAGAGRDGQLGQPHAVGEPAHRPLGHLDGQPRLAAAARAQQGDQPPLAEHGAELGQRVLAAHERAQPDGQVVAGPQARPGSRAALRCRPLPRYLGSFRRPGRRAQPPGEHVAVQLLGPPVGRHGQAVLQGVGQRLVLAQRRAAVTGQRIAADQRPLRAPRRWGRPRPAGRAGPRPPAGRRPPRAAPPARSPADGAGR